MSRRLSVLSAQIVADELFDSNFAIGLILGVSIGICRAIQGLFLSQIESGLHKYSDLKSCRPRWLAILV